MKHDIEKTFDAIAHDSWQPAVYDPGTSDWQEQWFLDGQRGTIRNTPQGMVFAAGPVAYDHASHAVLWTKACFQGDVKLEWEYTRLDTITRFVNIVYLQAAGTGQAPYDHDIAAWSHLRDIPLMRTYFTHMRLLHISYAAFGNQDDKDEDYVRARYYPVRSGEDFDTSTAIAPDYQQTGLFRPGITYHFTIIKTREHLLFEVRHAEGRTLFHWDIRHLAPVNDGRIGIRHMWTRCSRYKDVRIFTR